MVRRQLASQSEESLGEENWASPIPNLDPNLDWVRRTQRHSGNPAGLSKKDDFGVGLQLVSIPPGIDGPGAPQLQIAH